MSLTFDTSLAVILATFHLILLGQGGNTALSQITPLDDSILQIALSPDGLYIAVMTMNSQGDTAIEAWNTSETTDYVRLIPELTIFDGFIWSPNSQYIATTGHRGNASGTEYSLDIYDILDEGYAPDTVYPRPGRFFGEFVLYEDTGPRPDYAPVWSVDSSIIAANFRDGIYFYDITDCDNDECRLLHTLDVGYVSWFDWQGDTLIILSDNTLQLWDVSQVFQ